jgi:hypothetical protein
MQRCFDWVIALGPILGVLGCSDPVPASSAVGLSLSLSQTASCPILPSVPDDLGNPPPNSSIPDMGRRVYDGDGGLQVNCTVKATGNGTFFVQASVSSSDPRVAVNIQSGSIEADGTGTAVIGLTARALPSDVLSPTTTPCSLNVIGPTADHVKAGAVWMRFNCPTLTSPPTYNCNASGEIVLENCKK